MDALILSIGTELVAGQAVDTNSAWLAERLSAEGVRVVRHVTVGDELGVITRSIRRGLEEAELVIATGGLGPTADDLTRQAIADAIGVPLEENAEALGQIEAMFARWQRPVTAANRLQALIPRGCEVVANPRGTAPGIHVADGAGRHLWALPGVPGEMKAMFEASVVEVVRGLARGACTTTGRILTYGLSEARLGEMVADLMRRDRNPLVGTTASGAIISVRILATGRDRAEAEALLATDAEEVRRRLGSYVFGEGEGTLQEAVGALLLERGKTVATAESCTGGLLAKRLTDVAGSSGYFRQGYVTYSNESKSGVLGVAAELFTVHGAVSEEVARAMAAGCRRVSGADLALSVTGIAGPSGGSVEKPVGLVFVGLAGEGTDEVEVRRLLVGEHLSREEIRDRSCKAALNMLRLRLIADDA